VRSRRAGHLRFDFTSLHETKKGCTGKPLLSGFCLTGLIGSCRAADDQPAKYEDKSIPVEETFGRAEICNTQDHLKSRSKD
jgi:hypothetical protein